MNNTPQRVIAVSLWPKRFAEHPDHFDKNCAIAERVAKGCQSGIDLGVHHHGNTKCHHLECMFYIAEYSYKVCVGGGNGKYNHIQVENNGSQSNDVVEIWAGQTNQTAVGIFSYLVHKGYRKDTGQSILY